MMSMKKTSKKELIPVENTPASAVEKESLFTQSPETPTEKVAMNPVIQSTEMKDSEHAASVVTTAQTAKEFDAFGSGATTKAAKINACLTTLPKKMKELMNEAGLTETLYNHLNKLVAMGKVVRTDEGYSL
jgi:hypothetical protein